MRKPENKGWKGKMLKLHWYLAGRWSWGRLYGVQMGSPTKSRIACRNIIRKTPDETVIFQLVLR
jgi:hypothetical protein